MNRPRTMTAAEIEKILPHRYPFALVDKILDYTPGQWAPGVKCDPHGAVFEGHFQDTPYARCADSGSAGPNRSGSRVEPPENRGKLALFGGVKTPASAVRSYPAMC